MDIIEMSREEREKIKLMIIKFAMQHNLVYDIGIDSVILKIPEYKEIKKQ